MRMCGKHPNIWMKLKSDMGISLEVTNRRQFIDIDVCPLCVKFAKLAIQSCLDKAREGRNERSRNRTAA